ncbi:hypothetical protein EV356DRAFT_230313 [Viridothelium virens]|uniref:Uncharacterized protein n=1 Tax=Viridothelium virens TaxID=1048519 RepID=A0A6A6H5P0_VIRVR|nr:hypothetical protein EV356DRAFT_230313 [Viridothelium virens]
MLSLGWFVDWARWKLTGVLGTCDVLRDIPLRPNLRMCIAWVVLVFISLLMIVPPAGILRPRPNARQP